MPAMKQHVFLLALLVLMLAGPARAASEASELRDYVNDSTQQLIEKLAQNRALYSTDPEAFYQKMDAILTDFVDFRRIAARVMGRYARQTTPEQRDEFVVSFKRSLFDTYAQALVSEENVDIAVKDAVINPQDPGRAMVQMEVVTSTGNRYHVAYSMYKNKENRWMMENVTVEGVNVGLAFRDRFAQEMEKNHGQIQDVIDGWSDTVKALNLDEEIDKS
ncbi:MAG TPA: ABC transporter substrate-binding protein [Marinobacter sp.]|nr:ABC transporter substrate-binding protein [Marinobacter sp.]